jgi:hypothetical protein
VRLLGELQRLRHVILNGEVVDTAPPAPRRDPPGWRAPHYGTRILRREVVDGFDDEDVKAP